MSLYEISNDLVTVINGGMVVDEDTGVVTFDSDNLEELQLAFDDKVEAVALFIKNLDAESKALRYEEGQLKARRESKERKAERLRKYLLSCLEQTGVKSVETTKAKVTTRKSEYVEIFNENKIPKEFVSIETIKKIDKVALKKAIKEGRKLNSAKLMERTNIQLK